MEARRGHNPNYETVSRYGHEIPVHESYIGHLKIDRYIYNNVIKIIYAICTYRMESKWKKTQQQFKNLITQCYFKAIYCKVTGDVVRVSVMRNSS